MLYMDSIMSSQILSGIRFVVHADDIIDADINAIPSVYPTKIHNLSFQQGNHTSIIVFC